MELDTDLVARANGETVDDVPSNDPDEHVYRLVVHLPAAEPLTTSTEGTTTDSDAGAQGTAAGGGL